MSVGADRVEPAPFEPAPSSSAWRVILHALRPRARTGQVLTGLLCAWLGFSLVVQVRHTQSGGLSALRQSDLVRLLDETTAHSRTLQEEAGTLERRRSELLSGTNQQAAALAAATQRAATQGILSGRLPAEGPGIEVTVRDDGHAVPATMLFGLLEELRNAGAEAVQLDGTRVVASTSIVDGPDGVLLDGTLVEPPYRWLVVGDPDTLAQAMEIAGGSMAQVRTTGATGDVRKRDTLRVDATVTLSQPRFAKPAPTVAP